ncbi:MAG: hypothetical protein M0017_09490, partial [Desulfobacteraceae bacterium]|nr:hypothetical protein [Desulfobacteraceae bacterium]
MTKPFDSFGSIPISGIGGKGIGSPLPAGEPQEGPTLSPAPPSRHARIQEQRQAAHQRRRRLARLAAIPLVFLVLYYLAGSLLVPYLLERVLPGRLAKALDRPVAVGDAAFNPFTLTVTLGDVLIGPRLSEPAEGIDPLLSFSRLKLDFSAASFSRLALICDRVAVRRPVIHLLRRQDGSYNLKDLLPPGLARLRFSFNNISVREGRLVFNDRPARATQLVEDIDLALPSLSNIA